MVITNLDYMQVIENGATGIAGGRRRRATVTAINKSRVNVRGKALAIAFSGDGDVTAEAVVVQRIDVDQFIS
jgi:hypothetical protein